MQDKNLIFYSAAFLVFAEELPIKLKTSSQLKMWHLLFVCSGQPRNVSKRVMHTCKVVVLVIRLDSMIFFLHSPSRVVAAADVSFVNSVS